MNNQTTIQVPVSNAIKSKAEALAKAQGYPSLTATIQKFLSMFATKELEMHADEEYIVLSPRARRRYTKMEEDIKKNRNVYYAKDMDEFLRQLRS